MVKKITLLFFAFSVNIITAQSINMTDSGLFSTGANATWNTIFTAASQGNATSGLAQTVVINITNLGDGTTYRIYKTTSTGAADFTQQGDLVVGENTIIVSAVEFNRNVKFQFSGSGSIEFDSFSHNGQVLYPFEEFECDEITIGESNLFISQEVDAWPFYLVAASVDDTNMNTAHSFEMNITCLPAVGANYRIYKTNSAGNDIECCVAPLTLGLFSKTVAAVAWDRSLRFQFSTGDIGYSSLSVNGLDLLSLEDVSSSVINIHPNPATGTIFIDGVQNIKSIKVYSILGSLEKEVFNTNQVDISELSSGIHLIKVDNGTITTKKIIKQ
ncbi:T9SS type A sorting domain-containing protein [Flavobacteriaceae bacterium]|nr:T9SS type A sorting domain-containing protein [Flavobacteriaceae bacterium]